MKCQRPEKRSIEIFCRELTKKIEELLSTERIGAGISLLMLENKYRERTAEYFLKLLTISAEKALIYSEMDYGVSFYEESIEDEIIREERILDIVKRVSTINTNELFLMYQPIYDLKSKKISGFEALARIKPKDEDIISPLEFIPIAETTKLIIPMGEKIIRESLIFLNEIEDMGFSDISISINASIIQILKKDFVDNFLSVIRELGAKAENINLEITESALASNIEEINNVIVKLKNNNIKVSIDDFGTGYSSLSRERDLKVDFLKIDKSFIDRIMEIDLEDAITKDIISMAHRLGHKVIAEGIEYEKQKKYLEDSNCDKIQGYLIAKPLNASDAKKILKKINGV